MQNGYIEPTFGNGLSGGDPDGDGSTDSGLITPSLGTGSGTDSGGSDSGGGTGSRRKRSDAGKPRGSRKAASNIEGLEKILLSVHAIVSTFTKIDELAIDEQEAKLLAEAAANVAQHYDVLPDPKTQAWINLLMVAGAVYGPRAVVIWNKPAEKPAEPVRFHAAA